MTDARKHHSVPQSLLRQFADTREQLFGYDKHSGQSFPTSVGDAAAERDFYSATLGGVRVSWEPAFQLLDDQFAEVVHGLGSTSSLSDLQPAVRANVPVAVTTQLLRTQLQRTSPADIIGQLNAIGEPWGVESLAITETESRLLHLARLLGIHEIAEVLRTKDVALLQVDRSEQVLWLSDNPVILNNSFPYGRIGLAAPGIEIYLPISPIRCLALFCPSIAEQIRESFDASHPRPHLAERLYVDLLNGIDHGQLVPISGEFIRFLNERQVAQSSRFLYSSQRAFSLADSVLDIRPELRSVTSMFTVGELGASPAQLNGMPAGTFLLLETGHRHHVLPVIDHSDVIRNGGIAVSVLDETKLSLLDPEETFDSATLIVDRQAVRYGRGVVLARETRAGSRVVLVKHANPSLQALMEAISDPPPR